jgi:hypothetical protein
MIGGCTPEKSRGIAGKNQECPCIVICFWQMISMVTMLFAIVDQTAAKVSAGRLEQKRDREKGLRKKETDF